MTRATFPRAARLLTPADFARLRGISRRIGSASFAAEVAPAATATCARLGLAVSRRVGGLPAHLGMRADVSLVRTGQPAEPLSSDE